MAKLKSIPIRRENKTGEVLEFDCSVTVDSEGVFYISFPEEVIANLKALPLSENKCYIKHSRGKDRLYGVKLGLLEKLVCQAVDDYMECEVESELIIVYRFISTCHYVLDKKGNIYANGYEVQAAVGDYGWNDTVNETREYGRSNEHYVVGFRGEVIRKVTFIRKQIKKSDYEYINDEDELGPWGNKLNSFTKAHVHYDEKRNHELPYTEQTAQFFYEGMIGLCNLANKLTAFMIKPDKILKATGFPMLPATTKKKKNKRSVKND